MYTFILHPFVHIRSYLPAKMKTIHISRCICLTPNFQKMFHLLLVSHGVDPSQRRHRRPPRPRRREARQTRRRSSPRRVGWKARRRPTSSRRSRWSPRRRAEGPTGLGWTAVRIAAHPSRLHTDPGDRGVALCASPIWLPPPSTQLSSSSLPAYGTAPIVSHSLIDTAMPLILVCVLALFLWRKGNASG